MATTLDQTKLKQIIVTGKSLSAQLREACTAASLSLAVDQVTQMSLTFEDDHSASIFRSGVLSAGASINYGDWYLTSDGETLKPGPVGPQLQIKAPSRFVTALRKQTGAHSWGNVEVSGWVTAVARSVGMRAIVQPGLGHKTLVRKKPENDSAPESTWDVLTQVSREVGVWLFEYGSTLVFAKPTWLVSSAWQHRNWPLVWDSWGKYTSGLAGMPEYEDTPGGEVREGITFRLLSADADGIRPGDTVRLSGGATGKMAGVWIVKSVDFPLTVAGVIVVKCQRPINPKIEPPRSDNPSTGASKSTKSTGAIAAATDRWVSANSGKSLNPDGAFGAQCVDVAVAFNLEVVGGPSISGNGNQWYANGAASGAYTQISKGSTPQKGDIACWGGYYGGGYGHVAIVLEDRGGSMLVFSQNPGPARSQVLSKSGLQGFLRPKKVK